MSEYKPTIGIEVHAELKTKSKMFCGCKNDPHDGEPNSLTCPVCLAHPGTLPVVNKHAVQKVLLVGRALGGEIATYSEFDRKNYFYPDIPKAYQLSQYAFPFVKGGELAGVAITRVHLEEDTARSQHDGEDSVIDFNRAGVPLMELVTEPVIHDAKDAADFAKELQLLLRSIGVSDANMERGEMRVEANISISKDSTLGTKVEVKNLNSFRSMERAIIYEVKRQADLLDKGEVVRQETRGWDEAKGKTFLQRSKETAEDYRYFPDPDIPKFDLAKVADFELSRLDEILPEIPSKIRLSLQNLGLDSKQTEIILSDPALLGFYRAAMVVPGMGASQSKLAANYLTSDISGLMQADASLKLEADKAPAFSKLIGMVEANKINSRVAKDLLLQVVFEGLDPESLAEEKGLLQDNSADSLAKVVEEVLAANPTVAAEFKAGKEASLQFLVGQGMKATRGAANPALLSDLIRQKLSE